MPGARPALQRVFFILCALASVWTIALALTGGFDLRVGSLLAVTSHRPRNPAIVAVLSGLAACVLSTASQRRLVLQIIWLGISRIVPVPVVRLARRPPWQAAPVAAGVIAVTVVTVGVLRGAFVAGGSDVYGYVSEAHLWATGTLRIEQPLMDELKWPFAAQALTPLGYRPAQHEAAIVPAYPPGLPMVMAVFERVGGREAVFYVVPVLGGLAVWATYLMGARLAGRTVGVSAAVLLATSPTFLIQLLIPMSDVPVTAWWALALTLLLVERRVAAFVAGLAVGVAILTRPNLVPVAAVPGTLLVWRGIRERSLTGSAAQQALLFAAGAIPACMVVAIVNARLYGSPLASAYGRLNDLYGWKNLLPNLALYSRWLLDTQTAVVLLAFLAPFVLTSRKPGGTSRVHSREVALMWSLFIVAVFISYLLYLQFDAWFWLRFLLPAFPPLFVLTSVGLVAIVGRWAPEARVVVISVVIGLLAWHGIKYGRDRGIFDIREGERRAVALGEYITNKTPDRAVFISMHHSGSIRYYTNRLTVRYDLIPGNSLDTVIEDLRRLGYRPYIVLEDWEEPTFHRRFQGEHARATLDRPPVAMWVDSSIKVRMYDPADADGPFPTERVTSAIIR